MTTSGAGPTEFDARLGSRVDKYTLVRLLGRGGMGAVYEARHAQLARRFAIKFLHPQFATNPDILRRFENEARAAGGLEHPNLAAVTDLGTASDGSPYLVLEYLEGCDCATLLHRSGPLPVGRACDIVVQACRGLALAHAAGIVHRDLKPENLFIARSGDGSDWVKVLDFGIAKLRPLDAEGVTRTGATLGTAYYMSPEQARGAENVDERTDVWALGVVLYQLLSGQRPFQGQAFLHIVHQILSADPTPLAELRAGLPPALLNVVSQAMHKDAAQRIPSVSALSQALQEFVGTPRERPQNPVFTSSPGETQATPATSFGGISVGNVSGAHSRASLAPASISAVGNAANFGPLPTATRRGDFSSLGVALAAVAVAGIAGVVWWRTQPERASSDGSTNAAQATTTEAPLKGIAEPELAAVQVPNEPAPMVAPAPSAAPSSSASVRSNFEQPVRSSNKRAPSKTRVEKPDTAHVAAPGTLHPQPVSAPNSVPNSALQIEQSNPYDP
jgi:eukaryotic-like serine/threonine-protein kinase